MTTSKASAAVTLAATSYCPMMDQLELRLTKLTMVSLAKSVWNNTKIKSRISDSVRKDSVTRWNEDVMPEVLRYSISITKELPKKLRTELEEVIVFIGEEICSWIKVLTETLRLDFKFAETIYLTPFGAIDECQIMEKYWLPNVEKLKGMESIGYKFSDLICILCQEDLIFEWRYEIVDDIKNLFSYGRSNKISKKFEWKMKVELSQLKENKDEAIDFILIMWLMVEYEYLDPIAYIEISDGVGAMYLSSEKIRSASFEIRKSILLISFRLGFAHLFKHLWNKWRFMMEAEVICKDVLNACKEIFRRDRLEHVTDYQIKKHFEIVLLLLNETKKQEIIQNNYEILLEMAFRSWPYQELFLKIFYKCKISSLREWDNIFDLIAQKDMDDFRKGCPIKKMSHMWILNEVLARTGPDVKNNWDVISCLARAYTVTLNINTLKIILKTNVELSAKRICQIIYRWTETDQFSSVEKFLDEMGHDRGLLKDRIKTEVIIQLLSNHNFIALDKLFSVLDKFGIKLTKSDIDAVKFIKLNYRHRFDSAQKFIKWFRNDADLIESYFRDEEISRDYIFSLFYKGTDFHEEEATNFFQFIFNSEEEIKNFKHDILLKDETSILHFALSCDSRWMKLGKIYEPNVFPLEKLIKFCEFSDEKLDGLKNKCIVNIDYLMDSCTSGCDTFIELHDIIKWLFKDKNERQKIIERFMESGNGLVMCNKMLNLNKVIDRNLKRVILQFYNTWVKPCKQIPEIRRYVIDTNSDKLTEDDKMKLTAMFNKLNKGENLAFPDVICFGYKDRYA